jgi:PAS domain S-box-containing protein
VRAALYVDFFALKIFGMQIIDRFIFDTEENILFIDFGGLRIETREQVDEMRRIMHDIFERHGKRAYGIVNYEDTEIAPEVMDYYGERIKELYDQYSLTTVRYSSSGLTRSVLRYLGAAKDLESNIFTTREEAVRAIQELKRRNPRSASVSLRSVFRPGRSLLGKIWLGAMAFFLLWLLVYLSALAVVNPANRLAVHTLLAGAIAMLLFAAAIASAFLYREIIRPLRKMGELARRLSVGGIFEPLESSRADEVGQLAGTLNDAAFHLQQEIKRLSGLYHISLMMGTGTEVSQICELLTSKIARLLSAEMCVILLYDESGNRIHAQFPAYGINSEQALRLRSGLEEKSVAAHVFKTGEPYLTNDASRDRLIDRAAAEVIGARELLAVPLKAGQRLLGAIEVINKPGGFLEEEKRLVTIFASQAAHLLQNAQLFEQVRESEERYRQIFENAVDGLYRSTPEGDLITVNPALATMLGYASTGDLTGVNLVEDLLLEKKTGASLLAQLKNNGKAIDVECEIRRLAGDPTPVRISVRAVTDNTNNQTYHFGIIKDITEQKRLAQQLIISERLAVVGELVAGVAHEVRNPLFGITTTLAALARKLEDRAAAQPYLDVVTTEVERLNYLMEQLLEHSRPIQLDGAGATIIEVINEVAAEFRRQAAEKNIELTVATPAGQTFPRIDRRKMHGVFTNLLENAIQHTEPGGQISLSFAADKLTARNGDSEFRIEIKDSGAGIAVENLHKVFEPFFTTRATGIGLGLAIVRKTIHDHGGTITVQSELTKGAKFVIRLPLENRGAGDTN